MADKTTEEKTGVVHVDSTGLLACPFCGGPARGPDNENADGGKPIWAIHCYQFCIKMRRGSKREVIADWNKRAS